VRLEGLDKCCFEALFCSLPFLAYSSIHIINIKENYYIYQFKQFNGLIEEQKSAKENDNQSSIFDIAIRHAYTPTRAPQGTRV
jgi:hypothetical protein